MIMPEVQELHNQFKSEGLEVMALTAEESGEVNAFLKKDSYTYPMYLDKDNKVARHYKVEGIPTTIVVDPEGKMVYRDKGADPGGLRKAVEKAMAAKKAAES